MKCITPNIKNRANTNRIKPIKTPDNPMKFNNCDRKVKNQPNGFKNSP